MNYKLLNKCKFLTMRNMNRANLNMQTRIFNAIDDFKRDQLIE